MLWRTLKIKRNRFKMFFYYLQARWDPIIEDFKLGRIPEKYFWMFGVPKK